MSTTQSDRMLSVEMKGAWEVGQWLGREKLNQYELEDCMKKARGLVVPSRNGHKLFDDVIRGGDNKPVKPLFLQQSGSLGRLMAGDPQLCWMISTIACLFQFHRQTQFVTNTTIAFILLANPTDSTPFTPMNLTLYHPMRAQLGSVIDKIVSSVWYNVVNAGCDTIPLPDELVSLCPRGHYLDANDFSSVAHILQTQSNPKAILQSDHLLRNILLLHYDGLLVVNANGKVIYESQPGNASRELEIHVKSICSASEACDDSVEGYKILLGVADKFQDFLQRYSVKSWDLPPEPGIRRSLYEVSRQYHHERKMWLPGIQTNIKCTAKYMMQWLLDVHVIPQPQEDVERLGFSVILDPAKNKSPYKIENILKRVPDILNANWGNTLPSRVVFAHGVVHEKAREDPGQGAIDRDPRGKTRELEEVLLHFPILQDLLSKVRPDCDCSCCRKKVGITQYMPRGCLRRIALEEAMLLLAHGIADGFNVRSVSAITDLDPVIDGITTILHELCRGEVIWDTWFGLAACVYLGCPFKRSPNPDEPGYGGITIAAIQYGNLAAVALWLDLSKELKVPECFELIGARGRLGVIAQSTSNDEIQFRCVEENFAIIETEANEDTSNYNSRFKKDSLSPGSLVSFEQDDCAVDSDVILISVSENLYRLFLRVKTPSHRRIIDPSNALSAVIQRLPPPTCTHDPHGTPRILDQGVKIYTFDEVLGRWPNTVQSLATEKNAGEDNDDKQQGTIHLTQILNTQLKQNVALALSLDTTTTQNYPSSSCFPCTPAHARGAKRTPSGLQRSKVDRLKFGRYVINFQSSLDEGTMGGAEAWGGSIVKHIRAKDDGYDVEGEGVDGRQD